MPDAERIKLLFDDLIPTELILNPAMVPAVFAVIVFAVISPVICADDAVMLPDADNINFGVINANPSTLVDLIPTESIVNPPIVPAVFAVIVFATISPVI